MHADAYTLAPIGIVRSELTGLDAAPRQGDEGAPEAWLEISASDADVLAISEGDLVLVESRRGALRLRARVSAIRPGVVFVPFHYGYWDARDDGVASDGPARAANELTITEWDPVSKQPVLKVASVRISRLESEQRVSPAPTLTASRPIEGVIAP